MSLQNPPEFRHRAVSMVEEAFPDHARSLRQSRRSHPGLG